jgi:cytoskeletal protein CcmA (bactofilin family)
MLGKRKPDPAVTLIAKGSEIMGDLSFADQLYVNGRIIGDVVAKAEADSTVVISDTGLVVGDIRAPNVMISGRVEGNVHAAQRIELRAGSRVQGNVHYRLMEMELGALVEGQLLHHDGAEVQPVPPGVEAPLEATQADSGASASASVT